MTPLIMLRMLTDAPGSWRPAFQLIAMVGNHEASLDAGQKAIALNPYDMGARGVLGICHLVIGKHRQAIELFSAAAQRGNSDPRYQWAALNAFSGEARVATTSVSVMGRETAPACNTGCPHASSCFGST